MDNLLLGELKQTDPLVSERIKQTDIPKYTIKPRHLESGLAAVKFGDAVDRPDVGTVYPAYFSLDTGVLSVWNGDAWKSVTLS